MKVICIDASERPGDYPDLGWRIKEGETYTVYDEDRAIGTDESIQIVYFLSEDPYGQMNGWVKDRFIPLSTTSCEEVEPVENNQAIINA